MIALNVAIFPTAIRRAKFSASAGKNAGLSKLLGEVFAVAIEIERKFLVDKRKIRGLNYFSEERIFQGYLSRDPTVRVRMTDERAFLTIKSATRGIERQEFEYEIPLADAEKLLRLCGSEVLKKYRRKISHGGHVWEVDFFAGRHAGLIIAEVELKRADEPIDLPDWVTKEVSNDSRYFNSNLVKNGLPRRPQRKD